MSGTPSVYPVTIVRSRYGGCYEGAEWLAYHLYAEDLPDAASGDDTECASFFATTEMPIGRGKDPTSALWDLARRLHS